MLSAEDRHEMYEKAENILVNSEINEKKPNVTPISLEKPHPIMVDYDKLSWKTLEKQLIIPQRLDQPINQFPPEIQYCIDHGIRKYYKHGNVYQNTNLDNLYSIIDNIRESNLNLNVHYGAGKMIDLIFQISDKMIYDDFNQLLIELASDLSYDELVLTATLNGKLENIERTPLNTARIGKWLSLMNIIQTIRIKSILEYKSNMTHSNNYEKYGDDFHVSIRINDRTYHILCKYHGFQFELYVNTNYFLLRVNDDLVVNNFTHYNYFITIIESMLNVELIRASYEYKDMVNFIDSVINLIKSQFQYPDLVRLMSNMESLLLYAMDSCHTKESSQICVLESLNLFMELQEKYDIVKLTKKQYWCIFLGRNINVKHNIFSNLLRSIYPINVENLGTASSIHKFIGLAEIDYIKGWEKYHNRTSDRYTTSKADMDRLILLARKEFTRGFVMKHKEAPKFKDENNAKVIEFKNVINNQGTSGFRYYEDLDNWSDLIPYNCLESCQYDDITPYLKDKACTKEDYNPYYSASVKELKAYLMRPNSHVENIDTIVTKLKKNKKAKSRKHLTTNKPSDIDNFISEVSKNAYGSVVRLVSKEKEQKEEGRFFGIAPFDMKIALSKMMELVKRSTKYYRDQIMTFNDMQRKMVLYDASQLMREKDVYSLMVDISGHNQSMTKENCGPLLEFVMGLYGIDNYGLISELFENIIVLQENKVNNVTYASIGQTGAIEGWMNQLWGLQSALIMRLYCTDYRLNTEHILTYSDDIDVILRVPNCGTNTINEIIQNAQNFYLRYGQLLKIKQTQCSGSRLTMLKNHFLAGHYSSTTIKRLMSMSLFSSKDYYCEQMESESISATSSSAIDGSITLYTICLVKNLYLLMLGYISFGNSLQKLKNEKCIHDFLDPRYIRILFMNPKLKYDNTTIENFNNGDAYNFKTKDESYWVTFYDNITRISIDDTAAYTYTENPEIFNKLQSLIISVGYRLNTKLEYTQWFFRIMKTSSKHKLLWLTKIYTPITNGGYGVMPLLYQSISGHSESRSKLLMYLSKLNDAYKAVSTDVYNKFIYKHYYINDTSDHNQSLISSISPSYNTLMTHKDLYKSEVIAYLYSKNYNNMDIKKYVDYHKCRNEFVQYLILMNKDCFCYRIVRKFMDCSAVTLIEHFIQKLENSSTILDMIVSRKPDFTNKVFYTSIHSYNIFFKERRVNHILYTTNTEHNLYTIRSNNYPEFTFKDVLEPTYDYALYQQIPADDIHIELLNQLESTNMGDKYRKPAYSASVKPKYQQKYEMNYHFKNPIEYSIFEAVRYAKWVIYASISCDNNLNKDKNNIVNTCNYILSYYTDFRYKDLEATVLTPSGGELFHRTDNQGFKSSSAIRIAPQWSGSVHVNTTMMFTTKTCGIDSNVNYDYLKCRLSLITIIRNMYKMKYVCYSLNLSENYTSTFKDVRDVYMKDCKLYIIPTKNIMSKIEDIPLERFYTISELLSSGLDITDIDINVGFNYQKLPLMNTANSQFLQSYRRIQMYLKETTASDYMDIPRSIRFEIMSSIEKTLFEDEYKKELNIDNFDTMIMKLLDNETEKLFVFKGNVESAIHTQIMKQYNGEFKKLQKICSSINIFHSVMKFESLLRFNLKLMILSEYLAFNVIFDDIDTYHVVIKENYSNTIVNHAFNVAESKKIKISKKREFNMIFKYINHEVLRRLTPLAIKDLIIESKNWIFRGRRIDQVTLKGDINFIIKLKNKPKFYKFEYTPYEIPTEELTILDEIHNIINWFEHVCKNHASLKSFDSPTGSQALQSQYNLFRAYINNQIEMTKVIDLCSGRGDGHLALNELNIIHNSLSRGDDYDIVNCVDGLMYDEHVNVLDINTIMKYLDGNFVHMDISFIKDKGDIWNTIINLLQMKKTVSIRMNWLKNNPTHYQIALLKKYKLTLYLPPKERLTSYHMYLLFEQKESSYINSEVINYKKSIIFNSITNTALGIKSYSVFDVDTDVEITTDDTMILTKDVLESKYQEIIDANEGKELQESLYKIDLLDTVMYIYKNIELMRKEFCTNVAPKEKRIEYGFDHKMKGANLIMLEDENDVKAMRRNAVTIQDALYNYSADNISFNLDKYQILNITTIEGKYSVSSWNNIYELYMCCHISNDLKTLLVNINTLIKRGFISPDNGYYTITCQNLKQILTICILNLQTVYMDPDVYNDTYVLIRDTIMKMKHGFMNPLQKAYIYIKRQLGMTVHGNNEMTMNLFKFRCIANRIMRHNSNNPILGKWSTTLKLVGLDISDFKEEDYTSDFTPPESFMKGDQLKAVMNMFGGMAFAIQSDQQTVKSAFIDFRTESSGANIFVDAMKEFKETVLHQHEENVKLYGEDYELDLTAEDYYEVGLDDDQYSDNEL